VTSAGENAGFIAELKRLGVNAVLAGVENGEKREQPLLYETANDCFCRLGQVELAATELLEELAGFEGRLHDEFGIQSHFRSRLDKLAAKLEQRCHDARDVLHLALATGLLVEFDAKNCPCSIHEAERQKKPPVVVDAAPTPRRRKRS
jgi:hypothetical protein